MMCSHGEDCRYCEADRFAMNLWVILDREQEWNV